MNYTDITLLEAIKEDILTAMTYSATEWYKRACFIRMATNTAKKLSYTRLLYIELSKVHHNSRKCGKHKLNLKPIVKMIESEIEFQKQQGGL